MASCCNLVEHLEKSQIKHGKIQQILQDLSKSQDLLIDDTIIKTYYDRLADIYCDEKAENFEFRHLYSEVFAYLTLIDKNANLDLNVLAENMRTIYEYCFYDYIEVDSECVQKITKLYDHINLEISRISTTKGIIQDHGKLNENINKVKKDIVQTEDKIISIAEKAESIQREYITILGIFASIVITFVAGMSFSASILNNMQEASIYRLLLTTSILGLVLTNSLGILTSFIAQIGSFKVDSSFGYIKNINIVLGIVLLVLLIMWFVGYGY